MPRHASLVALLLFAAPAAGQSAGSVDPSTPIATVMATPAQRYPAGALHRLLLGAGHRDLWATPVPAPVLDLGTFAGGLTVTALGGGQQTRSLRFLGADGRPYNFRSIDKDATRTLEPELRRSVAATILQDQISSLFPLSALVVAPLLEAAGVLHAEPRLFVMPDDERLGEHRAEFAGLLGWMEERPDEGEDGRPGFAGSRRVVGSDRLFELLEENPENRVAARSFLRARLLDVLVGDWDRHPGQWRWARFERGGTSVFEPVPRDRDWALARIDGAITWFTWVPWPHYLGFEHELPSAFRATWNGRALDRRILTELPWEEFERVVTDLVARLDDEVLADAVARLPASYRDAVGAELEAALRNRRDGMPRFARAFYEQLAGWIDVHATDLPEIARVERLGEDSVRVELFEDRATPFPWFARTYSADETHEVRVHLRGGDDQAIVTGAARGRIVIRIDGGGGDDRFRDETSGERVTLYDGRGDNVFEPAARTAIDRRRWREPVDPEGNTHMAGMRDWGARTLPVFELSYSPDWGVVGGVGAARTTYGFRQWPYETRVAVIGGASSATGRLRGHVDLHLPVAGPVRGTASLVLTGAEVRRFYGFGNDTREVGEDDRYDAQRRELRAEAYLHVPVGTRADLALGTVWRRLEDLGNPGTVIDSVRPYGFPDFGQATLEAGLSWRGDPTGDATRERASIEVLAGLTPAWLDVGEAFGTLGARGAFSLPLAPEARVTPVLAMRAGARTVVGDAPYHEGSFLGGRDDLRGYHNQRFVGESSVFASAELRLGLGDFFFLLPGDVGVFGLTDVGRVFQDDESSSSWHSSFGGGLWVSFLSTYSASLALAHGEILGAYFSVGFAF